MRLISIKKYTILLYRITYHEFLTSMIFHTLFWFFTIFWNFILCFGREEIIITKEGGGWVGEHLELNVKIVFAALCMFLILISM